MIEMTIELESNDVRNMLKRLPLVFFKHQRRSMDKSVKLVQRRQQAYPPAPPSSSYRRTGTLGRRWSTQVRPIIGSVRGEGYNPTPYYPYVQGEDQAQVHAGRWTATKEQLKKSENEIVEFHKAGLEDAIREVAE